MEQIYALLNNEKIVWCAMAIIIYLITFAFSFFYKKLTDKIESEIKRKIANKVIVVVALGVSIALQLALCHFTKMPFMFEKCLVYAMSAMTIHELTQVKSGGKMQLPFNPSEVKQELENFTNAQLITQNKNKENSENQAETPKESALDKFYRNHTRGKS